MSLLSRPGTSLALPEHLERPVRYLWDKPSNPGGCRFWKGSYLAHFEPLGWHLCSSVYEDEMQEPVRRLHRSLLLSVLLFLLGGTLPSTASTRRLVAEPLERNVGRVRELARLELRVRFQGSSGSSELGLLIERLETLSPMLVEVRSAMGRQTASASDLGAVMADLSREMASAVKSLRGSYAALEVLRRAADDLAEEVDRFRVEAEVGESGSSSPAAGGAGVRRWAV